MKSKYLNSELGSMKFITKDSFLHASWQGTVDLEQHLEL